MLCSIKSAYSPEPPKSSNSQTSDPKRHTAEEMSSESGERRPPARLSNTGARPPEPEHLPCPRCESTNTKFCYYNNYNLSQPRHFCKSCRRYWTRGGTLRNIPVGGGTRKSSASHKRPRTTAISAGPSSSNETVSDKLVPMVSGSVTGPAGSHMGSDVNLNEALPYSGSFTSLLTTQVEGFSGLGGFGFGLGLGSGLQGSGFGLGVLDWPLEQVSVGEGNGGSGGGGPTPGCNTWQMGSVEGSIGDGDCFGWPDLAISTTGKRL